MQDEGFVRDIAALVPLPVMHTYNGRDVLIAPQGWHAVEEPRLPAVTPLKFSTLDSICDYLKENRDGLVLEKLTLHVEEPGEVSVYGQVPGLEDRFRRAYYALASAGRVSERFGQYHGYEEFVVWLRSGFVQTPETEKLLTLLGSITASDVQEDNETGVSQVVTTKRGVHLKDMTGVQAVWTLAPFRTFREVTQPESDFILRLQGGTGEKPRFMLAEAGGGAWKLDAVDFVASYLMERRPNEVVVLS